MNNTPFILVTLLAGMMLPLQAIINGRLASLYGSSVLAGATSFQVGALALFAYHFVSRGPVNKLDISSAPLWIWVGGILGTIYIVGVTASVSRLGAASLMSLLVLGQITAALLLDHFGVLNSSVHAISMARIVGAAFLIIGVWLVTHY